MTGFTDEGDEAMRLPWRRRAPTPTLVCMRLDRMVFTHPDQINDRVCATCGRAVGIYPSGQQVLRDHPETTIVCDVCQGGGLGPPAPGAIEEALEGRGRRS